MPSLSQGLNHPVWFRLRNYPDGGISRLHLFRGESLAEALAELADAEVTAQPDVFADFAGLRQWVEQHGGGGGAVAVKEFRARNPFSIGNQQKEFKSVDRQGGLETVRGEESSGSGPRQARVR